MTMTQEQAERALVEFLVSSAAGDVTIDRDMDLIESRVLSSMQFMNFILLIEELTENPIAMEEMNVDDFRTLRTIRQRFLSLLPDAHGGNVGAEQGDTHV